MKLYSYTPAPNPRRLQMLMKEKGIEIAAEQIDLMKGEQFGDKFKAINPESTVPVLITDDGVTLTQVVAICEYLDAAFPQNNLLGVTPLERGLIREWCNRIIAEGFTSIAEVFRNSNPAFAGRSLPGSVSTEQIPALVDRGNKRLDAFFAMLDHRLQDREHIAIDRFSMADIDAYAACEFAGWIRRSIPDECANLKRWYGEMAKRPCTSRD